jgi:hypothetical protein
MAVSSFNVSDWFARARNLGFIVVADGCIVRLLARFEAGSTDGFVHCDMFAGGLLAELPATQSGSTWGTDGASVGGMVAVRSGCFQLNRSGISKRVVVALAKLEDARTKVA